MIIACVWSSASAALCSPSLSAAAFWYFFVGVGHCAAWTVVGPNAARSPSCAYGTTGAETTAKVPSSRAIRLFFKIFFLCFMAECSYRIFQISSHRLPPHGVRNKCGSLVCAYIKDRSYAHGKAPIVRATTFFLLVQAWLQQQYGGLKVSALPQDFRCSFPWSSTFCKVRTIWRCVS